MRRRRASRPGCTRSRTAAWSITGGEGVFPWSSWTSRIPRATRRTRRGSWKRAKPLRGSRRPWRRCRWRNARRSCCTRRRACRLPRSRPPPDRMRRPPRVVCATPSQSSRPRWKMTDERGPKVSRRYRELGAEDPPAGLDAGIRGASRRAVAARLAPPVAPTGRRRWYFPVAAAAIITLAVAVTVHVGRQQPDAESIAPPPPSAPESRTDALEAKKDSAPQAELRKAKPAKPPAASAPAPDAQVKGLAMRRAERGTVEEAPERILERIAELRRQGKQDEADKALAEFRRRYPDYRIAKEMLKKVERQR